MADKTGKRSRNPRQPVGPQINIEEVDYQISFDIDAFDSFIQSQGIWVTHWRAIPDPRGMASVGDNRDVLDIRPHNSDGFIYKESGKMQVLFSANSKSVKPEDLGEIAFSTAYMTMPRFYADNGKDVVLHTWDKLYLNDIEIKVSLTQFVESDKKGIDRLRHPAVSVSDLIDANGVTYEEDQDFKLSEEGHIVWLGQKRPGWNATIGKGVVYSIRYMYTPYFIVDRLLHEIRVSQATKSSGYDFKRYLERMPYQTQVIRENAFLSSRDPGDDPSKNSRKIQAPDIGGGPSTAGFPSVGGALGPKT